MAKPTTTRAQLRRAICKRLGMPFYLRYDPCGVADGTSSTSKLIDSSLAQPDDFWNNGWIYIATDTATGNIGVVRKIDDFVAADDALLLEYALPSAGSTGTQYEILTGFSPHEIHQAIDDALDESFPAFFNEVEDKTVVVQEDTLEYDISALSNKPWIISDMWLERSTKSQTGIVTAAASRSLTDSDITFDSDIDTSWKLSIYDGTGAGQLRTVKLLSSNTITTATGEADWTTTPDTTSKYRVWDAAEQTHDWFRLQDCHFDQGEFPSTLYLRHRPTSSYGLRIRLNYATAPISLSADSDETSVPRQYVILKATELLSASRVSSSKVDREKWAVSEQLARVKAEDFKERNSFRLPTTVWLENSPHGNSFANEEDPMGWNR